MITSLYACGPAKIEIGKYGMSLEDAHKAFLKTCEALGVNVLNTKKQNNQIRITLNTADDVGGVLNELANVYDLHGDPPDVYILACDSVSEGEYIKTGKYND